MWHTPAKSSVEVARQWARRARKQAGTRSCISCKRELCHSGGPSPSHLLTFPRGVASCLEVSRMKLMLFLVQHCRKAWHTPTHCHAAHDKRLGRACSLTSGILPRAAPAGAGCPSCSSSLTSHKRHRYLQAEGTHHLQAEPSPPSLTPQRPRWGSVGSCARLPVPWLETQHQCMSAPDTPGPKTGPCPLPPQPHHGLGPHVG